jgi:4-hydroxy-tetrahydrodipicolinate reductase
MRRYRIVQWATGNIGRRALRAVIEHPDYDLVGVHVSSPEKAGKDAGALCGLGDVGVRATTSLEDIVRLDADCVLYMRHGLDAGEVARLLASGKNIVTTRGEFHHPPSMDASLRAAVEAACAAGNASIYSTGSSPGFVTEALTLPLLSLQRRLDRLTIDEYADVSSRDSPDMIFNVMGFGAPPESFDRRRAEHVKHAFAGTLAQIAEAIGKPIERFEVSAAVAAARRDIAIAAGVLPEGGIAAQRLVIDGYCAGAPLMRMTLNWYCSNDVDADDVDADWEFRETGWRVRVEGDTPLDVAITFPIAPDRWTATTPGYTAHRAVNAIPAVCAAAPGICTTVELPQVVARL